MDAAQPQEGSVVLAPTSLELPAITGRLSVIVPAGPEPATAVPAAAWWRWPILLAAGAGAFALAYTFAAREPEVEVAETVTPAGDAGRRPNSTRAGASTALALPVREPIARMAAADPFVAPSFVPPPPPAPPPVIAAPPPPPPPPTAPALPFSFVGLLEKGAAKPAAFIAKGDALLVVSAGDVLDGIYRVESLSPTEVVLTYLPLDQKQTLAATGANK